MDGDQSFLDTIGFGYTQTQPDSPIGEQATPSTQHRSAITEKGKSNKGKNWSSDEDKVLIAAWANTSLDIVGTDQNRDAYWDRISEYYNTHKESSWPERMLLQSIAVTQRLTERPLNFVVAFSRF